jgi:hypothetical protein
VREGLTSGETKKTLGLRIFCFLACIPSGGALLGKVYGLASLRLATLAVALPCCVALVVVWVWARRSEKQLAARLEIGFVGGLLGSIAYDLIRIPFHMTGQRIFAPISAFGVWLAEADMSSRFTEVLGWAYHYSNGITFGIMFTLFMKRRHWGWAILWAFVLETIAVLSPFGRIFSLQGNYYAIGIAYLGHVAYGLPLGWLAYKWGQTREQLAGMVWQKSLLLVLFAGVNAWPLVSPESTKQDARAVKGEFRVEGRRLNPDWLRIRRGQEICVYNPGAEAVSVREKKSNVTTQVAGGQKEVFVFRETGVYQMFVETDRQTQSSFVMVEPVEELK